jgi:uncharacterized membrane protein YozB (DUF420 family)
MHSMVQTMASKMYRPICLARINYPLKLIQLSRSLTNKQKIKNHCTVGINSTIWIICIYIVYFR